MERFDKKVCVYVACMPFGDEDEITDEMRRTYVNNTHSASARRERYYVWKLLERACAEQGLRATYSETYPTAFAQDSGVANYSLSHSNEVVAVALSRQTGIGVDVEKVDDKRFSQDFCVRVFSPESAERIARAPSDRRAVVACEEWTKLESVYKSGNDRAETQSRTIWCKGNEYVLTVATPDCAEVEYTMIDVEIRRKSILANELTAEDVC